MIHLYCGDGKGKTTASVGLAVRACGSGKRVMFTQFLKGQETGELSCLRLLPEITVLRGNLSKKFTFQMTAEERKAEAAENERLLEEAFHQAFVAATHNPFMEQLLPIIHNALHETWAALDVEALLAQPTLQDNELLMGFLQQRDEEGVRHTMAAHIRRTINLLDQAGFGSV